MLSRQLISPKNVTKICTINSLRIESSNLCQQKQYPTFNSITREYHEARGDIFCPSLIKGAYHLIQPRLNKGLAFTLKERQKLGITGLMPARIKTLEEQLFLLKLSVDRYQENLNKYLYLTDVHDRNETLFFRFLADNVEEMMPIVYTPTVGLACQKFGLIYRRPRGLFITIHDRGHIFDVLKSWPEPQVRAIVVTDGERILGLGDLGAYGIGIPVGKLALYTALAGIKPHQCLPILLDVGTNNEELLTDPLYVGLRQKRVVGQQYDDFIEEFMEAVVKRYDQNTLIQFEDFGNHNAFKMLDKYRDRYCTFNDDIQGTGAVVVGGLLASKRLTGKLLKDNKFLFVGAGEASLGIANMCEKALQHEGLTIEEARSRIWMCDVDGLLTCDRNPKQLEGNKKNFAKNYKPMKNLEEITEELKPSILIGATAAAGIFTPKILQTMAKYNKRPLIFALSNPNSKVECTAEDAYKYTEGRAIFSSGSPFGEVKYNGKTYHPGQGNNAYIFPGVALGIIASQTHHVSDEMFLIAAQVLADNVTADILSSGSLYPPLKSVRSISMDIALQIIQYAYSNGYATVYPEPKDKRTWLQNQLFTFEYENHLPDTWEYPEQPKIEIREISALKKDQSALKKDHN